MKEIEDRDSKNGIVLTEWVGRQQMNEDVLDKIQQKGNLTVSQKQTAALPSCPQKALIV